MLQELIGDLRDMELVCASQGNVLIETLQAGTLGLPTVIEPVYFVEEGSAKSKF